MRELDLFSGIYKGKKILVTGDTGFIGSWLCIWLRELGADVYGYALPTLTNQDNFITTELSKKINHTDGDVRNLEQLQNYFNQVKPDFAFHLAAQTLVIESYQNPHYNFETNLMGTVNFFEAVRNCPSVKVAINVTTDKCYQNNEWMWGYRENDPMGGDDPYSASKGCSELITNSYIKSFFTKEGTANIASVRAGNVVGGGDWAENRIIPDLIRAYQTNQTSNIRNPNSIRPWQFVLEPLSGYLSLAEKLWSDGKSFEGGWNFGPLAFEDHSVGDVVNEVKKIIPSIKIYTEKTSEKFHEATLLKLEITKAINRLKWKPKLNFEETIQYTINGYLEEFNSLNNLYDCRVKQIEAYCKK
jgi:CDP-glucose 4,6-dehydratase